MMYTTEEPAGAVSASPPPAFDPMTGLSQVGALFLNSSTSQSSNARRMVVTPFIRMVPPLIGILLAVTPSFGADAGEGVTASVQRGVAYLKKSQKRDGSWAYGGTQSADGGTQTALVASDGLNPNDVGATALAALALLECGVSTDDPAVQTAARFLRQASFALCHTYAISLSIMFFDRMGIAEDVPLIESLMVRLLAGQNSDGTWSYICPPIAEGEVRRLRATLKQRPQAEKSRDDSHRKRDYSELALEIKQQLSLISQKPPQPNENGDNSNTQFATLALWIGRRQGLPVRTALLKVRNHFRNSQIRGGWNYKALGYDRPAAGMTCAGLLGLAVAFGSASETPGRAGTKGGRTVPGKTSSSVAEMNRDAVINSGLICLANITDRYFDSMPENPQPAPPGRDGPELYFLFSLERVMVACDLEKIGDKEWYGLGARLLVATQSGDGSWWQSNFVGKVPATCFALLFLARANLASDLTIILKGRVKDPGIVRLTAGGVGGAELKSGEARPITGLSDKPDTKTDRGKSSRPKVELQQLTPPAATSDKAMHASPAAAEESNPDPARLTAELAQAPESRQAALIEKLQESKGIANTQALAAAIPLLSGTRKQKARDALAARLARMTASTLRDKLQDEQLEVRRAAALALAMKEDRKFIPDLINLLGDSELGVARAAHAALKSLTGEDFGPKPDAGRAESAQAIAKWKAWWAKNSGK
jgi:hypothetical protein